ncbi:MerR family transcriptional regulator [Alkalibacter rhizosphaerae]|uniref:MerR family transcriptional regulator n=1 Tax=Alkalibacter rhizosphaerae TaxID=2815577 RepID=A0A974XFZ2_9FIRM|nr:MerR family transcriptional regulator [Alkalibacter rhizosphaerae]QSX09152.1 MerR family transcriptional regulator [Alkalibacter rhizosphaerae]
MEYTIQKLAKLAGVTPRTLRYYDEIGLLKPCRSSSSGYRIYGKKEVDLLQQILFYRSMDMPLEEIQKLLYSDAFDFEGALVEHRKNLLEKRDEIERLIATVELTISHHKGESIMSDKQKFEGFKKQKLVENEQKYGKEIREKYGDKTVAESNKKFMNLTQEDMEKMNKLEVDLIELLRELSETKDIKSDAAKKAYELHREWLCFSWPTYQPQAHVGLAEMYVADQRFAAYYQEKAGMDVAELLRDVIVEHAR